MDDILKLAKDYSKKRHLDLLPHGNNNILENLDFIYDEIKKQIIELIIPLGSKLNVSELQDKFGVRKMKRNLKESILKTF